MSLTERQRIEARYKGGDEIRKRKSYLKRSATAIRALADETMSNRNALHGVADTALIEAAGLRPDARAEQIDVNGFVRLANLPTT